MPPALLPDPDTLAARLEPAILTALRRLAPKRAELRMWFFAFARTQGAATLRLRPLSIEGHSGSWESARRHAGDVAALTAAIEAYPVAATVEWGAAPWAAGRLAGVVTVGSGTEQPLAPNPDGDDDARVARATAVALAGRLIRIADLETPPMGSFSTHAMTPSVEPTWLHPGALATWERYAEATGMTWGRYVEQAIAALRPHNPDALAEGWHEWVLRADDADVDQVLAALLKEMAMGR